MRHWNAEDCAAMPWKNGGGITTELAIAPQGATLDNFEWRVSSALVTGSGPFSHFIGVDRSLAVLQGGALSLQVEDMAGFDLTPASEPFRFRGEQRIWATVAQGAISDLNVMTRRGSYSHQLLRLSGATEYLIKRQGALVLVYCAQGSADIRHAGSVLQLRQGDMLMLDQQDDIDSLPLQCRGRDVFYVAHLSAQQK
ncbi:HutD family protein [Undibacterium sp.]|jgi:environmental stress-induced protein Ves|uniref:HutD/Ves family protein n=1 Tax=Undibacterium sp. TaxID=1914977 RepID=UPI002BC010B6|nr:HutD family protein [Undibacterium sp.]HTD04200.1 HutD family protein [Undibacterium sp.]